MKLVIAVIQNKFANKLVDKFIYTKFKITQLSSTGGFLKSGNTTFIIGAKEDELEEVKKLIRESVETEKIKDNGRELTVNGAVVFVTDINKALNF